MIAAVSVGRPSLWQEHHDARLFLTSSVCDLRALVYHACILDLVLCSYNALLHGTLNARADDLRRHAIGRIRGWASYSPRMRNYVRELFHI